VYQRPGGPFAYGRFALTSVRFNDAESL
jgi:hypothetical protein